MSTEKMREEFEVWAEKHHREAGNWYERPCGMFEVFVDGSYQVRWLESDFVAWQASRAAIEVDLPKIVDKEWANTHAERSAMREAIGWCKKRIESLGIKVKP